MRHCPLEVINFLVHVEEIEVDQDNLPLVQLRLHFDCCTRIYVQKKTSGHFQELIDIQ